MDYRPFVEEHRQRQADVSIAVKPVRREQASELGILQVNEEGRIVAFCEKPQTDEELDALRLPQAPGDDPEACYLASMGIYIFEPQVLTSLLVSVPEDDFGRHIIPKAIESLNVYVHTFDGYWEDIGTIGAFYRSNISLVESAPSFEFYHPNAPIYTRQRFLAATKMHGCRVSRGIVAEGCIFEDASIEDSVIGVRSVIGAGATVSQSIVMGADYYQTPADKERDAAMHLPSVGIGAGSVIQWAIIDKNARIGENVVISNTDGVVEADGEGYYIREGIVVIPKDGVIADGMKI